MKQRTTILIATALTAFVLVLVGGLAARLSQTAAPAAASAPSEAAATAAPALDPTVEALVREREAAYQKALAEANARLEAANAQITQMNGALAQAAAPAPVAVSAPAPVAAPAPAPAPAPAAAPTYAVSAEQAQAIALAAAAGATLTGAPDLVSYGGVPAYEVRLDRGLVYVDAQSGAVLSNGAAAPPASTMISRDQAIQAAQAYRGGGDVTAAEIIQDQGGQVYQVTFSDGGMVYVDPASGQVVYAKLSGPEQGHENHESESGDDD
jgi:uncharacterized membrane protein YkoI